MNPWCSARTEQWFSSNSTERKFLLIRLKNLYIGTTFNNLENKYYRCPRKEQQGHQSLQYLSNLHISECFAPDFNPPPLISSESTHASSLLAGITVLNKQHIMLASHINLVHGQFFAWQ
jgi:hypothetical protein